MVLLHKSGCRPFVSFCEWLSTCLFPYPDFGQLAVKHDYLKDTLVAVMQDVDMDGLMLIGVKIENKSKILKYLWHRQKSFFLQTYCFFLC